MKKARKSLLLALCAVALVVTSVMGTMAYLTSTTETVTNTFTVGQVTITLDEAKVDDDGKIIDVNDRGIKNNYTLAPGGKYDKDPIVHVNEKSENSWIFVEVVNGLAAVEAASVDGGYQNIDAQIQANGWKPLENVDGVYYMEYTKGAADRELEVFQEVNIATDANTKTEWANLETNGAITITAYAVQKADTIANQAAAWAIAKPVAGN